MRDFSHRFVALEVSGRRFGVGVGRKLPFKSWDVLVTMYWWEMTAARSLLSKHLIGGGRRN